jgi:hypothetical protein
MPVSLMCFTLSQLVLYRVGIARYVPELANGHDAVMGIFGPSGSRLELNQAKEQHSGDNCHGSLAFEPLT